MIGITLTTDQIRTAPVDVRQWIERQVIASLGLGAETPAPAAAQPHGQHLVACSEDDAAAVLGRIRRFLPAINVFFEFGRAGICYGQPPVMSFRLLDILHHTRLQNVEQVIACLEGINKAMAAVRRDDSARFCAFDNQGHCLVAPQTQQSVLHLWQNLVAKQQATAVDETAAAPALAPAAENGDDVPAPKSMPAGYVKTAEPIED